MTAYKIRHKPTGKFMGSGLNPYKPEKVWLKLGYARNSISQQIGNKAYFKAGDYEIVEFIFQPTGVVHEPRSKGKVP